MLDKFNHQKIKGWRFIGFLKESQPIWNGWNIWKKKQTRLPPETKQKKNHEPETPISDLEANHLWRVPVKDVGFSYV